MVSHAPAVLFGAQAMLPEPLLTPDGLERACRYFAY
jgi:hypothetical protein